MGVINALDIIKIPTQGESYKITRDRHDGRIREVKVKDIARRAVSFERGTKLNQIVDSLDEMRKSLSLEKKTNRYCYP